LVSKEGEGEAAKGATVNGREFVGLQRQDVTCPGRLLLSTHIHNNTTRSTHTHTPKRTTIQAQWDQLFC